MSYDLGGEPKHIVDSHRNSLHDGKIINGHDNIVNYITGIHKAGDDRAIEDGLDPLPIPIIDKVRIREG